MNLGAEQRLGLKGELWALDELAARGWQVRLCSDWLADVDLVLEGCVPVEVKLSLPHRQSNGRRMRTRWEWDLARLPRTVDSLVILIARDEQGVNWPFIAPSWLFFGRGVKTAALTSHPLAYAQRGRGYLAPYFEAWSSVGQVVATRLRLAGQLSLFAEV